MSIQVRILCGCSYLSLPKIPSAYSTLSWEGLIGLVSSENAVRLKRLLSAR
jgi:hypothetical protein